MFGVKTPRRRGPLVGAMAMGRLTYHVRPAMSARTPARGRRRTCNVRQATGRVAILHEPPCDKCSSNRAWKRAALAVVLGVGRPRNQVRVGIGVDFAAAVGRMRRRE